MNIKTLTVSEVTNYIKRMLDNDFILNNLSVKGEISNLKYHSSGHIYFSLKDDNGKVNCVMFKGNALFLDFVLEEGMEVIVKGRASIYPATGSFQLYCDEIKKEGQGELFVKFEKLKQKLSKMGYFDEGHKKILPKYPQRIGVVTSPTGAAIRDIINVSTRRSSLVDIVLYPAKVQGIDAYKEVIEGIKYFNNNKSVDIIIVGRGGGSIEELWNFNEEELAKAIYISKIPIISAVGHEIDYTISDFVADVRAATPSQGAEIAVPLSKDIEEKVCDISKALEINIDNKLKSCKNELSNAERILKIHSPITRIANSYLEIDNLKNRLNFLMKIKVEKEKKQLENLNNLLLAYNPVKVISKGYAIIQDDEKNLITSKEQMENPINLEISVKDGKAEGKFIPLKHIK
ncbi:exodeoxyribonuclease VII large subunit [Clostridium saccharobutylicum]|uniref:Exodeoxyribonuclease 7 large subunit n=1 Tax=Clostridium saccharobutylicum DSM 13864 TaxID=1345695 RepID=U5MSZ8_CLOSA|nr:exodeoxyribonuclease VII large subunit [Clostridium saccharobutylicum]AGX43658.1 exodeoxyribonuclease 7 large subunit [Clostridium saccharobutylicum DSM 13864]AQR90956.1 exodeoxyribonuclease 7 large subunit [Clostridium saccharobutylicum]AQS00860.1 exodeoxyribonuclease 7 large subunit [Clostridium saccharobutylicum]AQS14843.1 exodeoxyribonuclease 7 large subunit [Clostridium saccharobutylicum]MBA2907114.1 exodeoxyribonuclease VII large subunit [Clostridium saccharobutylicum]